MVIFHSYVSLPEGTFNNGRFAGSILVGGMVYWKHHRSNWSLKQWRTLPERSPSKGAVLTARIHIGRLISRSTTVQAAFLCISKIGVWSCRATGRTSLPLCWEWCFDALQSHHRRWCDYHRNLQHFWNVKRHKFGARHWRKGGSVFNFSLLIPLALPNQQHIWNTSLLTIKLKHFNNFCVFRSLALALVVPS